MRKVNKYFCADCGLHKNCKDDNFFKRKIFCSHHISTKNLYLCTPKSIFHDTSSDFVAQLVEQLTLNQWVEGSSPSEVTS